MLGRLGHRFISPAARQPGSILRQSLEKELIKVSASPEWVETEERFFGR